MSGFFWPLSLATPSDTVRETPMETEDQSLTEKNTADKLLSLRKEFKKNSVAMVKTKAHQTFISSCKDWKTSSENVTLFGPTDRGVDAQL